MSTDDNRPTVPPIPVGLEQLLAMAGASPEFERALLDERERAVEATGVALTDTERQVLRATPDAVLAQMIAQVKTALPETDRRVFFEQAAFALAVLVGAGAVAGCSDDKPGKPAKPMTSPPAPPPRRPMEDRRKVTPPTPPTGIRPDLLRPPAPLPPPRPRPGGGPMKPKPKDRAGARINRPQGGPRTNAGVSPGGQLPRKRPRPMKEIKTRGISPFRHPMTGHRVRRDEDE